MEGLITTEPEQSEEAPQLPVVVNCEEMLADKQMVTQLVGGGSRPTSKAKPKVLEPKLPVTEHDQISTHDSSTTTPVEATATATSTTSSVEEAKREKARRKKKLKKERERAAKAAAAEAAAAAAEAATTATAATGASTTILGAFDGVD